MRDVQLLNPDVIAKIAAGEVVDRPSSVVKELLENAIDAEATSIEIHLKDAGKELIHIKDNGHGISKTNLDKMFSRHATSKITQIDDLEKLWSMGFRGEALYSIAAVSDITLKSQVKDSKEAWSIHLQGGQRQHLEPAAPFGHGTEIKVSELFFNTPARRKFLKSNTSELNHIIGVVVPYALIYPSIRFVLTHAGKTLFDLKPTASGKDRAAEVLNIHTRELMDTSQDFPQDMMSIQALLGNINLQRSRRDMQYIFINNRPVESKSLSFAMNDVYRALLPPGIYPGFVLRITLDPARVDVNIHPTKREVRIKDEARLISMVRHLTEYTLMQFGAAKSIAADLPASMDAVQPLASGTFEGGLPASQMIFAPGQMRRQIQPMISDATGTDAPLPLMELFGHEDDSLKSKFQRARYIGSFINKYILFEESASLFMVDQHAAQERIMFEHFSRQIDSGKIETQPLLTPLLIKLNYQERVVFDQIQEHLDQIGIECTLFDEDTLAVSSQPVLLKNITQALRTLLAEGDLPRCDRSTIARRACKASIVTGDKLSPEQALHQRMQLLQCQDPFTCPHGRPTVIELKESFLDRQFMRS